MESDIETKTVYVCDITYTAVLLALHCLAEVQTRAAVLCLVNEQQTISEQNFKMLSSGSEMPRGSIGARCLSTSPTTVSASKWHSHDINKDALSNSLLNLYLNAIPV